MWLPHTKQTGQCFFFSIRRPGPGTNGVQAAPAYQPSTTHFGAACTPAGGRRPPSRTESARTGRLPPPGLRTRPPARSSYHRPFPSTSTIDRQFRPIRIGGRRFAPCAEGGRESHPACQGADLCYAPGYPTPVATHQLLGGPRCPAPPSTTNLSVMNVAPRAGCATGSTDAESCQQIPVVPKRTRAHAPGGAARARQIARCTPWGDVDRFVLHLFK